MAVDWTRGDRPAPERPKRSGGRPGKGFLVSRGMGASAHRGRKRPGRCGCRSSRASRGGLWSDMPHRDRSGRASWRIKGYTLASSGGDQWEWMHSAHKPQTLDRSQRLDLGGSRERCIASSRCWLWYHAWMGDKTETCSLPHSQLQIDHTLDQSGLQAARSFPPCNRFLKVTNGQIARSNLAANRLYQF